MPTNDECEKMNQRVSDVQTDIHGHIRELRVDVSEQGQKLEEHIIRFEAHEIEQTTRHNQQISCQNLNTEAINNLTASVSGVVEIYTTTNSVIRFIKYIGGAVLIIGAIAAYFMV